MKRYGLEHNMGDNGMQDEWLVQSLRLTLFTSGLWSGNETIWHDLTAREPEIDENRVRESVRRQIGREGDGQLETLVTPVRTDIVMSPPVQDALQSNFGQAEEKLPDFVSLVSSWLSRTAETGKVNRVAFGAVLLLPVDNREAGYRELDRLLTSVTVDPINTKELLYRINRPKIYQGKIELNRLTTWTSVDLRKFYLATSLERPSTPISGEAFVRLEVDHSTPVERIEPLPSGEIVPMFNALVEMAVENAARGEQP
jgi:hypothetical protein